MFAHRHVDRQGISDTSILVGSLDTIARDYATTIRLAAALPVTDRRRCLQKSRQRYRRLLDATLRSVDWLTVAEAPR